MWCLNQELLELSPLNEHLIVKISHRRSDKEEVAALLHVSDSSAAVTASPPSYHPNLLCNSASLGGCWGDGGGVRPFLLPNGWTDRRGNGPKWLAQNRAGTKIIVIYEARPPDSSQRSRLFGQSRRVVTRRGGIAFHSNWPPNPIGERSQPTWPLHTPLFF